MGNGISGLVFMAIPEGSFVMGSRLFGDNIPRWVELSSYSVGVTAVTERQFGLEMEREIPTKKDDHPASSVTWEEAGHFMQRLNNKHETHFRFLTEAEWENAARGPAVNIREQMRLEGIDGATFAEWAGNRYENFVSGLTRGAKIFTDMKDTELQTMLRDGHPLYAWRVYGTPSGRLTHREAWYDRCRTAPVDWGPVNANGIYGLAGGVSEWCADSNKRFKVTRGGAWHLRYSKYLRAAYRNSVRLDDRFNHVGFRIAIGSD